VGSGAMFEKKISKTSPPRHKSKNNMCRPPPPRKNLGLKTICKQTKDKFFHIPYKYYV